MYSSFCLCIVFESKMWVLMEWAHAWSLAVYVAALCLMLKICNPSWCKAGHRETCFVKVTSCCASLVSSLQPEHEPNQFRGPASVILYQPTQCPPLLPHLATGNSTETEMRWDAKFFLLENVCQKTPRCFQSLTNHYKAQLLLWTIYTVHSGLPSGAVV